MKLKIEWNDWMVLIVLLCATISILSNNPHIKIILSIAEIIIVWFSLILMAIIAKKEEKEFERKMREFKKKIEGELKNDD